MRELPKMRNGLFLPALFGAFAIGGVYAHWFPGWRFAGAAWLLCVFGHLMNCRWAIAWRRGRDVPRIGQELWPVVFLGGLFAAEHSLRAVVDFPLEMLLLFLGFLSTLGIGAMVFGGLPTWPRWRPPATPSS